MFDQSLQSYASLLPYEKKATLVGAGSSAEIMQKLVDLQFEVETKPLFLQDGTLLLKSRAIVSCQGEVFGVVSKGYEPIQNSEIVALADQIMRQGGAPLAGGRAAQKCYLVFGFGAWQFGGDEFLTLLTLTWGHGGSHAVFLTPSMLRLYCRNQFPAILGGAVSSTFLRVTHFGGAKEKLQVAAELALGMIQVQATSREFLGALSLRRFKQADLKALAMMAGASEKQGEKISEFWDHDLGRVGSALSGTAYHALNALTGWASNTGGSDHSKLDGSRCALVKKGAEFLAAYIPTEDLTYPTFALDLDLDLA